MKKRDFILVSVLVLIAALFLIFGLYSRTSKEDKVESSPEAVASTDVPPQYSESVVNAVKTYLENMPAESYLLVRTKETVYSPIPLVEENSFTITQPDGSENVVHIGKNEFSMESSNCDNQNCVHEGIVTLDNMATRTLYNAIYCLPHQVTLEMLTPSEAEDALYELYAQREAYLAEMKEYFASLEEQSGEGTEG